MSTIARLAVTLTTLSLAFASLAPTKYDPPFSPPVYAAENLTGTWIADDGGIYYVRQINDTVWWAGMSTDSSGGRDDFQRGLFFTNVFQGRIPTHGNIIIGEWADVPRGRILQSGRLTLDIVPSTDVGGFLLRKRPEPNDVFGANVWRKVPAIIPPPCESLAASSSDINCKFNRVKRNDNGTMQDQVTWYKDNVVLFGTSILPMDVNYPPRFGLRYGDFFCRVDDGDFDGDIKVRLRIDRGKLEPNFWTDGWRFGANPNVIKAKLDDPINPSDRIQLPNDEVLPEVIMYGRTGQDSLFGPCDATNNIQTFLPGWMENDANSVLLNGRPVNGQVDILPTRTTENHFLTTILNHNLPVGTRVRVTGVLGIDNHTLLIPNLSGSFDILGPENARNRNVEIHPVYSIEILRDPRFPPVDLTGAWAATDVGTYYVRQVGDEIWWLGLSKDRGLTFANVFRGTLKGDSITGEWADVPLGAFRNYGTLNLTALGGGKATSFFSLNHGIFQGYVWDKLYDGPTRIVPPG